MDDQPVGFNQKRPEEHTPKQQQNRGQRNPDSLLPNRRPSPGRWSRPASQFLNQDQKKTKQECGRDKKHYGHILSGLGAFALFGKLSCVLSRSLLVYTRTVVWAMESSSHHWRRSPTRDQLQ